MVAMITTWIELQWVLPHFSFHIKLGSVVKCFLPFKQNLELVGQTMFSEWSLLSWKFCQIFSILSSWAGLCSEAAMMDIPSVVVNMQSSCIFNCF